MSLIQKKILGIPITISSKYLILEEIVKYLSKIQNPKSKIQKKEIKPLLIFTPNPEIVAYAQKDKEFKRIVAEAQINIPDGQGVVWALKYLHGLSVKKLTGIDFMREISTRSSGCGFTIGLIGAREGVALKVCKCLQKKHPKLKIRVFEAPQITLAPGDRHRKVGRSDSFGKSDSRSLLLHSVGSQNKTTDRYFGQLLNDIDESKIDILFVAFGFPKQEYFIEKLKAQSASWRTKLKIKRPLVMMGVGGAFDYIAGSTDRAPRWMQNLGLEWLFRLVTEPWRFGRQLRGAEFFLKVFLDSF